MKGKLQAVERPYVEPVLLDEALTHCHANPGVEDAWFVDAIRAARVEAENFTWRAYMEQTWAYWFDGLPDLPLYLPRAPLVSVEEITVYDRDDEPHSVDMAMVQVDANTEPGRVMFRYGERWPEGILYRDYNTVKIEFVAGYGDSVVPSVLHDVKAAILLHVAHNYNNRAGETPLPDAFYNILRPTRLYQ